MDRDTVINKIATLLKDGYKVLVGSTETTPKDWTVFIIDRIKVSAIPPLIHGEIHYRVSIDNI